jgi:hypothetical protein
MGETMTEAREPTPYERFVAATKQILSVSKAELEKREKAWRKRKQSNRRARE